MITDKTGRKHQEDSSFLPNTRIGGCMELQGGGADIFRRATVVARADASCRGCVKEEEDIIKLVSFLSIGKTEIAFVEFRSL
jgi:hypothetical protein